MLIACSKQTTTNTKPELSFSTFEILKNDLGKDSLIALTLKFNDQDGDIGLEPTNNTFPFGDSDPYFSNLFVSYFVLKNNVYSKVLNPQSPTADTIQFNERLPNLTPTGNKKWIRSQITLLIPANPFGINPKNVKFSIFLIDRKLNKSNLIITNPIELTL